MRPFIASILCLTPLTKGVLATLLVLTLGTAIFHRPLWRSFSGWQAGRLAAEAQTHATAGEWKEASRTASASYQLRPSIETQRLLLEAFARTSNPQVLQMAVGLFANPSASATDRARALEVILDSKDVLTAARLVQALPASEEEDPVLRFQRVRLHLETGNYGRALELADALPPENRNPRFDLLLAEGLARSGQTEARAATAARIKRALGGEDRDLALRAMRLLAALPDTWIHESLAKMALDRFGEDDTLIAADQLRLDLFRIGTKQVERSALIDAAVARHRDQSLDELIGWLSRLGELDRLVDLTSPEENPDGLSTNLFQHRSRALQALGRLDQLEEELKDPPAHVPEVPLLVARASVATLQGKDSLETLLWRDTLRAAERDQAKNWFYMIANAAGQVGDHDRQMEALARAIEHPFGAPPPAGKLDPLFTWLYETGDTERLLGISRRLIQREPGNPTLVNNYHYLKVLHGQPTERDLAALQALVEAFPTQVQARGSLALAFLKSSQPDAALATLDALDLPPAELPDAERAIYAATLHALEREEEATALTTSIDWTQLPAEEARILKEIGAPLVP